MCSHCEDELHRKPQHFREESSGASDLEIEINRLQGRGRALPESVGAFFSERFGRDLSAVRVHTDPQAAKTARAVGARAYTRGTDIVFAPGEYRPETIAGKRLLAHELTHVAQQSGGGVAAPVPLTLQRSCNEAIGTRTACTPSNDEPVGDLVLFKVGCDEYLSASELNKVKDFADSMETSDRVRIHGFASSEGQAKFNQNLSCARAEAVQTTLAANRIDRSHTEILTHGPTKGPATQRRSVVLERVPGTSRAAAPQLSAPATTPLAPGICGGINFVAQWTLNRNSAAAGGFVIQEINETWDVKDCAGKQVANPDPRTSPLRFFEAWRVPPASAVANPFTSDTWFWPSNLPWAGGCTNGTVAIRGSARYFDNVSALPAHMIVNNPATFSGPLQSSVTDPALITRASRPVDRALAFHWTCCPCSSSPTAVDSSTL
jgi:outer membrane protein OmpA-like peptidoglycan-associated protein